MSLKSYKTNNQSPGPKDEFYISEDQRLKLIQEALDVHYLLERFEEEYNNPETMFFYVISLKWLTEWKHYTSYDNVIQHQQPDNQLFGLYFPTKINTNIVLENYYMTQYPDRDDYRNVVLKEGIHEKKDYVLITEAAWKYLAKKYNHITIKRPVHKFPNGEKFVEVALKQIQLVPLNNVYLKMMDRHQTHEFNLYRIQASAYTTIIEFKGDFVRIAESLKNTHLFLHNGYAPSLVSEEFLRLWMLDPALDLRSYFHEVQTTCDRSWTYNYQILFKGHYLEKDTSLTLDEAQITDDSLIFIDSRSGNLGWALIGDGAPILKKCEYCALYGERPLFCQCKEVSYCSEKCQTKDLKYHEPLCAAKNENKS